MTEDLISLAVIVLVAAACPLAAQAIPKKPIPETVFLLIAGAVLGPNMVGAIHLSDSIGLLSELGLAFLFLLAGYEIDPKNITGHQGKRGFATWLVCLGLGFGAVALSGFVSPTELSGVAFAIALGTTALGTLIPILKERNLLGTRVGDSVLAYGTWGELGPIIAMALLLSTRAEWKTVVILMLFGGGCRTCRNHSRKGPVKLGERYIASLPKTLTPTSQDHHACYRSSVGGARDSFSSV